MAATRQDEQVNELLDEVRQLASPCGICPRECNVDRIDEETGFCGVSSEGRVFRSGLLIGEEQEICPSYAFWFAGCNLTCSFCSTRTAQLRGALTASELVKATEEAKRLIERGVAKSVSFIGGEPSVSLLGSLGLALRFKGKVPVVWNTNLYVSREALELLKRVVDVLIVDIHFGSDRCAWNLASADDYLNVVVRNLRLLGDREVFLRHLLLPGHGECCLPGVADVVSQFPGRTFSLLANFSAFDQDVKCDSSWGALGTAEVDHAKEFLASRGIQFRLVRPGYTEESLKCDLGAAIDETIEITIDRDGSVILESQSPSAPKIASAL